ncbi:MAG: metallophosphoesterase family protein [Candidatus Odinarchaeota archaeon]
MKVIGLISDTHVPSRRKRIPDTVFQVFKDVDMIIHAGDFEELSIVPALENIAPLVAVRGNMCHQEVRDRFPEVRTVQVEDLIIGVYHGSGGPDGYIERVADKFKGVSPAPDIVICGHTHRAQGVSYRDTFFINPGSPTDRIFAPYNSIAILQVEGREFSHEIIKTE